MRIIMAPPSKSWWGFSEKIVIKDLAQGWPRRHTGSEAAGITPRWGFCRGFLDSEALNPMVFIPILSSAPEVLSRIPHGGSCLSLSCGRAVLCELSGLNSFYGDECSMNMKTDASLQESDNSFLFHLMTGARCVRVPLRASMNNSGCTDFPTPSSPARGSSLTIWKMQPIFFKTYYIESSFHWTSCCLFFFL